MDTATDTDCLLDRIQFGDEIATELLFARYRPRLRSLIAMRLDQRIAGRIDASDVVQDALTKAAKRIIEYAKTRPIPFYPWLRKQAIDRVVELHRQHIRAQRRSVAREYVPDPELSQSGRESLVQQLIYMGDSPSQQARLHEDLERAQAAVDKLSPFDREVLVLRFLEQLTLKEAAAVLGISENAFAQRQWRALRRVRSLLKDGGGSTDED